MYVEVEIRDLIRIPPKRLGLPLKKALSETIREVYNMKIDRKHQLQFIELIKIEEIYDKRIFPNDGGVFVDVKFRYLAYNPIVGEVSEGIVSKILESIAFINLGYFDGLMHRSQVFDGYVEYDANQKAFVNKQTKKSLKSGNKVRVRIVSVGYTSREDKEIFRVGLTMRQPGLGLIE